MSIFKARVEYEVTDTSVKTYSFPFPYLRKEFIKVSILHTDNSVTALTYGVDYSVDDLTITLVTAPSVSEHLIIYRETTTDKIITWNDGSILLAKDMNTEDAQMLHLQEEQKDYLLANALATSVTGNKETIWSAQNHRITDVSDPKEPQDAVTKHYMENVQGGFISANTALVQEANKQASAAKTSETNAKTSETNAAKSAKQAAESAGVFQDFKGATATTDGTAGKVPKPLKGNQTLYLKGDGTWSNPSIRYGNKMNITDTSGNELEENILSFIDTNNTERITCKARYKSDDGNGGIEYRMRLITAPTSWYDLRVHVDRTSTHMYAYLASNRGVNLPFGATDSSTNIPTTAWVQSAIDTKLSPVATNANSREKVNSSGTNWIRYESGLQLCWTNSVAKQSVWTYPVAFSSNPVINGTSVDANWVYIDNIAPTSCRSRCNSTCMMMAVGRWK